jgi:hypothetical protein
MAVAELIANFLVNRWWKSTIQRCSTDIQWLQDCSPNHLGLGLGLEEHYSQQR